MRKRGSPPLDSAMRGTVGERPGVGGIVVSEAKSNPSVLRGILKYHPLGEVRAA